MLHVDAEIALRHIAGHKLPGKANRIALEVVSKREIPEHLKEGVVPRGMAHLLKVVVLAARAHALLTRGRAPASLRGFLVSEEHLLELHHPRVGE